MKMLLFLLLLGLGIFMITGDILILNANTDISSSSIALIVVVHIVNSIILMILSLVHPLVNPWKAEA